MKRLFLCVLVVAGLLVGGDGSAAEPLLEKIDLFEAGVDGYALYRIPGIVVTKKGTVLAYCEARKSGKGDWGSIDVMLRRSSDGGRTWAPRQLLVHHEGPLPVNPVAAAQNLDKPGDNTVNNPLAIVDRETGEVHFLYCLEYMRSFYMRSDDDGVSWTEPVEITPIFEQFRKDYDWKVIATGPDHGIQLAYGPYAGRLVVPVWMSLGTGGHAHRPSVVATIFSDDHGRSWQRGQIAVPDTPPYRWPNETVAVQLTDGRVMLNTRSESDAHRRLQTTSPDGATGWSKAVFNDALLEPICMASIVRYSRRPDNDKNRIVFANPHNLDRADGKAKPGTSRDRRNLSVKMSYDEGKTWPVNKSLEPGYSAYSDLAVLPDGTILCFYERGREADAQGKKPTSYAFLTLARFNVEWLTDGKDVPQLIDHSDYGAKREDFEVAGCQLALHNPIERLAPIAQARIPILHIHGNADTVVPLEENSQVIYDRYRALGGPMELIVVPGKGHQEDAGFFQSQPMLDFLLEQGLGKPVATLPITMAAQIEVGGLTLQPAAPPRGLKTDASLGVVLNESMQVSVLHYIPGYRADVMRAIKTPRGDYLAVVVAGEGLTGGKGHYAPPKVDYSIKSNDLLAYRSSDKGKTWSGPKVLFPVPYSLHGFVPLIPRGSKRIYCFGTEPVPELREGRENAPIAFRYSDDDGRTWSAPTLIRPTNDPDFKGMSCTQMTETEAGTWLIGSHSADWGTPGAETLSQWIHLKKSRVATRQYLLRSTDQGKTWTVAPGPRPQGWFLREYDRMDEARPLALGPKRVLTLARTPEGRLWEMRSDDDGKTWSVPKPTSIVHPDAPPMLFTLSDGKTLIVFHHNNHDPNSPHFSGQSRNQLWCTISTDEGRTWSEPRFVMASASENRREQISYVDLLADEGNLHLFVPYAWKQTLHVRLREADLAHLPTKADLSVALAATSSSAAAPGAPFTKDDVTRPIDVCIYGATPAGIVAAVAARQEGSSVVIIEPGRWLGGMLGAGIKPKEDCPEERAVGGLTSSKVFALGSSPPEIRSNFAKWLQEEQIPVVFEHRIRRVEKDQGRIVRIDLEHAPPDPWGVPAPVAQAGPGRIVQAKVFIDASYEGDLMAKARVGYAIGREPADAFGEKPAGVGPPTNWTPIDPYVRPGDPQSGLIPLVELEHGRPLGAGDDYTQAYNFRYYVTTDPEKRAPLTRPDDYDPRQYELVGRYVEHIVKNSSRDAPKTLERLSEIFPGWRNQGEYNYQRKALVTMAPLGVSRFYQDGDWPTRSRVWRQHIDYLRGLHYFLCTDPRVPAGFRKKTAELGLDRTMHADTQGWPNQLYVRISRRMSGPYVLTHADVLNQTQVDDGVGLALYGVDTYPVRRYAARDPESGRLGVATEGNMFLGGSRGTGRPYAVPYRAITPKAEECSNLLVPVCFSASYIAYASARMEPVFCILGESAGVAAAQAVREGGPVQAVNVSKLQERLIERGQVLQWKRTMP